MIQMNLEWILPQSFQNGTQHCWHLAFGLARPVAEESIEPHCAWISDLKKLLNDNGYYFKQMGVVICYSSNIILV